MNLIYLTMSIYHGRSRTKQEAMEVLHHLRQFVKRQLNIVFYHILTIEVGEGRGWMSYTVMVSQQIRRVHKITHLTVTFRCDGGLYRLLQLWRT